MLMKIYEELVTIRKELQAIRSSLEPKEVPIDGQSSLDGIVNGLADGIREAMKNIKEPL